MGKSTFKKFTSSMKFALKPSQIIGFVTFRTKDCNFEPSQFQNLFNILASAVVFSLTCYNTYQYITEPAVAKIYRTTNIIAVSTGGTYCVTVWIWGVYKSGEMIQLFNKIIAIDGLLQEFGLIDDKDKQERDILIQFMWRLAFVIIEVLILMFTVTMSTIELVGQIVQIAFLALRPIVCLQMTCLVYDLKTKFALLNNFVVDLKQNRHFFANLCKICNLHHRLCKFIHNFNRTFGLVLLVTFGASFVLIVISVFYITANLEAREIDWTKIGLLVLTVTPFILDVVYVCKICYITAEEAKKIGEIIHTIHTTDHDIIDVIEMFSLQIANHRVEFTAAKFFPIDNALLFTIIGGVITYIIILIQLAESLY